VECDGDDFSGMACDRDGVQGGDSDSSTAGCEDVGSNSVISEDVGGDGDGTMSCEEVGRVKSDVEDDGDGMSCDNSECLKGDGDGGGDNIMSCETFECGVEELLSTACLEGVEVADALPQEL